MVGIKYSLAYNGKEWLAKKSKRCLKKKTELKVDGVGVESTHVWGRQQLVL